MERSPKPPAPARLDTASEMPLRAVVRRLLDALDRADRPLTVQEIADMVRRHHTGVRPQLAALVRAGLVDARTDPPLGRGRPATRYTVAPFARTESADLHLQLLTVVGDLVRTHGFSAEDVERFGESQGYAQAHDGGGAGEVRRQLATLGFTPRPAPGRDGALELGRCPLAHLVAAPGGELVCSLHRGLTRGMARRAGLQGAELEIEPLDRGPCRVRLGAPAKGRGTGAGDGTAGPAAP